MKDFIDSGLLAYLFIFFGLYCSNLELLQDRQKESFGPWPQDNYKSINQGYPL